MNVKQDAATATPLSAKISPLKLAGIFLILVALASLIGAASKDPDKAWLFPYLMSASACLLYAVFTSVAIVTIEDVKGHWARAVSGFIVLLILGIGIATLTTGINVVDAASYYTIYSVVTIGYLVFLSIMRGVRFIIDFSHRPNLK